VVNAKENQSEVAFVDLILLLLLLRFLLRAPEKLLDLPMLRNQEDLVPREEVPSKLLSLFVPRMMLENTLSVVLLSRVIRLSINPLKSKD
jgi:hypothetical protein